MNPALRPILIGEFLGTLLLIVLGDGVVASVQLLDKQADWIVITTGWALAVTLGVYVSARLSGGHLNPAVTLALAARGEVPLVQVPVYIIAQLAGAIAGAILVYMDYAAAFAKFEQTKHVVRGQLVDGILAGPAAGGAGVFATYPAFGGVLGNLFSEFLGTAVLLFAVRAVTDRKNSAPGPGIQPLLVGSVVFAIGLSLGGLTGYAINPARDLGPRIASALLGWGSAVFVSHGYYFWVPIVGPLAGGLFGVFVYDGLVRSQLPAEATSMPADLSP